MINLILCGGTGTRLWPLSRTLMPKQFYPLFKGNSLFEETVQRNRELCDAFWIASNKDQMFLAVEQMARLGIKLKNGLMEPVGRNTAPAIAIACFALDSEDLILVTPSDHLISNRAAYQQAVSRATELAKKGALVTFGIKPTFPETGFGYIEADGEKVLSFKEKPDYKLAENYLEKGNFLWNSGMFLFKVGVYLDELKKYAPDIFSASQKAFEGAKGSNPLAVKLEDMQDIPSISIDYAVLEKSRVVSVVACDIGWSDLGSFDSLYQETFNKDLKNAVVNADGLLALNSKNNLIVGENRTIALVDVEDLVVVDSPDALLVAKRGSGQKVKEIVTQLKKSNSSLLDAPMTVKKPWGSYTVLQDFSEFKVKRLDVLPGKRLSLQKHSRRQEHWVVVSGTAIVTLGNEISIKKRNEYVYIPLGEVHRLENGGDDLLSIIETQIGDYFGEDDIVRIEDDYNRN